MLAATLAVAAVLPATITAPVSAQESSAGYVTPEGEGIHLRLPAPTGPHAVGVRVESVFDPTRLDATTGRARRLPLHIWYPARSNYGPTAPYLSPFIQGQLEQAVSAPAGTFAVDTHATKDAPARGHLRGVILAQPGGGSITAFQTGLIIDLASRGYAVVAMEIPHESVIVEEPDGTVIPGDGSFPFDQWRVDAQVVLDDLRRLVPQADSRTPIGMFGHSRGGAATIDTMFHDERIRAGVSLDTGTILFGDDVTPPSEVIVAGLDQPLGLMCSLDVPCDSPHLVDFTSRLRGPHPERTLNIRHNGYTDFVVFNPQAARVDPVVAANLEAESGWPTGTVDSLRAGRTAMAAQRAFLGHFMARYLTD